MTYSSPIVVWSFGHRGCEEQWWKEPRELEWLSWKQCFSLGRETTHQKCKTCRIWWKPKMKSTELWSKQSSTVSCRTCSFLVQCAPSKLAEHLQLFQLYCWCVSVCRCFAVDEMEKERWSEREGRYVCASVCDRERWNAKVQTRDEGRIFVRSWVSRLNLNEVSKLCNVFEHASSTYWWVHTTQQNARCGTKKRSLRRT